MAAATKKSRKHGRNKKWCERYRLEQKHEKSHARRVTKHLSAHPTDQKALGYWRNLPLVARNAFPLPAGVGK